MVVNAKLKSFFFNQWSTLVDATRSGAVQCLYCAYVDFSALDADAFLAVVGCRGLQSLLIQESILPNGLVMGDLIRCGISKGLRELRFYDNQSKTPHGLSDDVILDILFLADAATERNLGFDGTWVTDMFLTKLFEVSTSVELSFVHC